MIHRVQLDTFEGPIELLLYLVREQELNIEEIPIARVTDQYLSYIQSPPRLSIENATEFLLMAVVLIRLKMRSLLPRPQTEDLETGALVSMDEIVAEFQRYRGKPPACWLRKRMNAADCFRAPAPRLETSPAPET